jgi:hypothetical protein
MIAENFYYTVRSIVLWFESAFRPNELIFLYHIMIMLLMVIPSFFLNKGKRTAVLILFFAYILTMGFFDKVWAEDSIDEKGMNLPARLYYNHMADYNFSQYIHFMGLAEKTIGLDMHWIQKDDLHVLFGTALSALGGSPGYTVAGFIAIIAAKYGNEKIENYFMVNYYLMAADHYLQMYNFHCDILRTE